MTFDLGELMQQEAAKRDRNWDPAERWRVVQETIAWLDSQAPVPRNSKAGCQANQARLLAELAEYQGQQAQRQSD